MIDDLEFMKNPNLWPHLVLPIKRYLEEEKFPQIGIVTPFLSTVYLVNLYDDSWQSVAFKDMPSIEYEDFQAVIDDGWIVD